MILVGPFQLKIFHNSKTIFVIPAHLKSNLLFSPQLLNSVSSLFNGQLFQNTFRIHYSQVWCTTLLPFSYGWMTQLGIRRKKILHSVMPPTEFCLHLRCFAQDSSGLSSILCLTLCALTNSAATSGNSGKESTATRGPCTPGTPELFAGDTRAVWHTGDPPEWHWSHHTHTDPSQGLCHIHGCQKSSSQITVQSICAHAAAICLGLQRSKNLRLMAKALKSKTHLGEI